MSEICPPCAVEPAAPSLTYRTPMMYLHTPPSYACLCAPSPSPAMRPTTQPHLFALSLSTLPCERDYSEPYSTPWAISPESVLPVGPSVVFSLIQYASVKFASELFRRCHRAQNDRMDPLYAASYFLHSEVTHSPHKIRSRHRLSPPRGS